MRISVMNVPPRFQGSWEVTRYSVPVGAAYGNRLHTFKQEAETAFTSHADAIRTLPTSVKFIFTPDVSPKIDLKFRAPASDAITETGQKRSGNRGAAESEHQYPFYKLGSESVAQFIARVVQDAKTKIERYKAIDAKPE